MPTGRAALLGFQLLVSAIGVAGAIRSMRPSMVRAKAEARHAYELSRWGHSDGIEAIEARIRRLDRAGLLMLVVVSAIVNTAIFFGVFDDV